MDITIQQDALPRWINTANGDMHFVERMLQLQGYSVIAGVDEAGRGPLAGPVVAAAVILPSNKNILNVIDSKLLSPSQRNSVATEIQDAAISIGIGVISAAVIDDINILNATREAIKQAVSELDIVPELLLIDGKYLDHPTFPSLSVIKGDAFCHSIAAASIIAKVHRDSIMEELHNQFPLYGFNKHKGYPTKEHRIAIMRYGLSFVHRKSFRLTPVEEKR